MLDIETRPMVSHTWGAYDQHVSPAQVVDAGGVLCWAAKWAGQRNTMFAADWTTGHGDMVRQAWELLDAADAVVTYNGVGFDRKHLNREFLLDGMPPPAPCKDIDLLKTARSRFKFPINKLEHVAGELGLGGKLPHTGFKLWRQCLDGDVRARRLMERYNRQDVRLTEQLYLRLRPWIKGHPHVGMFDTVCRGACPVCGGQVESAGKSVAAGVRTYPLVRCVDCGHVARSASRGSEATTTRSVA